MKGSTIVKTNKTRKYAELYRAWFNSDHDTMIIRCPDKYILQHAQRAAIRFRDNNGLKGRFSISQYNGDLYLMRIGDQQYAMEAYPNNEGWIFYYDTNIPTYVTATPKFEKENAND